MAITNGGKGPGILDDPEAILDETLGKSEEFLKKNTRLLSIVLCAIVIAAAGYFYYKYQNNEKDKEAQAELFGAVYYFEADSLDKALNGDGKDLGFKDISEDYPHTKAANLANFYTGVIYLKKGKFDDAVTSLENFKSDDLLLQARAYALAGDAKLELKDLDGAAEYYKKAAEYYPNEFFTPRYLLKLAFAHELNKDYEAAVKDYDKIINIYYKSSEANDAKKRKAFAEEKISK
jgi:tetratricopeptide (TPR) repeat protein